MSTIIFCNDAPRCLFLPEVSLLVARETVLYHDGVDIVSWGNELEYHCLVYIAYLRFAVLDIVDTWEQLVSFLLRCPATRNATKRDLLFTMSPSRNHSKALANALAP